MSADKIRETYRRIRERGAEGVWISLVPEAEALAQAAAGADSARPLGGMTFAIKDNIDLAGLPTTAACPAFARMPSGNAFVVERLIEAGAVAIGKTNLDQFATGLNGTRSPCGIPRNVWNSAYVSGGSSSGSAVAVAAGLVDFALGTDTAGSGRVPAAFNNLVGFKPTRGRWSVRGVVPACRTLDCVTVFTRNLDDAERVDAVVRGFDCADPFSRAGPPEEDVRGRRVGVLRESDREFFGDLEYARLYREAIERAAGRGWSIWEFDYSPFSAAAALLYEGPWVAERYAAVKELMETQPGAIHPVVRAVIEKARGFSAVDAFEAQYRLAALARETLATWERVDALLLPTAGTIYTIEEMLAEPVARNSDLGRYTNFMNLLDLCGVALPAGFRADGLPFGVTLAAPAWHEALLFAMGRAFLT